MLAVTLALLVLPALTNADTGYTGDLFGGCKANLPTSGWLSSQGNRQTVAQNGAYTVAYRDAQAIERGVTCPKLSLNAPGGTYLYTFKDKNGNEQSVSGALTYGDGVFTLDGMPTGHFGADCGWFASKCSANLLLTFGNKNGLHFVTGRGFFIFCTRNSYFLVPPGTSNFNCQAC